MKHIVLATLLAAATALSLPSVAIAQTEEAAVTAFQQQALELPATLAFEQQRHIRGLPRALTSRGHLYVAAEEVIWETEEPTTNRLKVNAEGITELNDSATGEAGEAIRGSEVVAQLLLALLQQNTEVLTQTFRFSQTEPAGCYDLTPRREAFARFFTRIETCGAEYVERLTLHEVDGNTTVIHLSLANADVTAD